MLRQLTFRTVVPTVALLCLVVGCAPGTGLAQEAVVDGAAPAAAAEVYLPEGFPETINFPTGTVLRSASGGMPPEYASRSYLVEGEAPLSKAEMASFFQTMLEKKGFEIVGTEEGYATVIWFTTPGLDEASVQIVDGYDSGDPSIFTLSMIMEPEQE